MGSTGHYQDIAWRRVSRISGQTPPTFSPFTRLRQRGGMHQRDGEVTQPSWNISSSGVPPPDRCVPHRPHHPSQPDMRYPDATIRLINAIGLPVGGGSARCMVGGYGALCGPCDLRGRCVIVTTLFGPSTGHWKGAGIRRRRILGRCTRNSDALGEDDRSPGSVV